MKGIMVHSDFTIDDIHRVREENYETTKNMTMDEKIAYYNSLGKEAEKEIEKRRMLVHI